MPLADARAAIRGFAAFMGIPGGGVTATPRTVPGPSGAVPVVVYHPDRPGILPILVYLHGGGWVLGDTGLVDPLCRDLAGQARCLVVSVDYRLAPEHPYPAAIEDCFAVARWVASNASRIGGDSARVAVGGDSAGGGLAAAVALMSRDRGGPEFVAQLLAYPALDHRCGSPSYDENSTGYLLSAASMRWFWTRYLGDAEVDCAPYASPLLAADLQGVAPAIVLTAEFDVLRDEGEGYAQRLELAGVPVDLRRYDGLTHGFLWLTGAVDAARRGLTDAAGALRAAFRSAAYSPAAVASAAP
jgi:acetyl esterase